jgi:hypothetical protein
MPDATETYEDWLGWWNEEEHRFLNLMAEVESAEIMSDAARLDRAAVLETARRRMREIKGRIAAVVAEVDRRA